MKRIRSNSKARKAARAKAARIRRKGQLLYQLRVGRVTYSVRQRGSWFLPLLALLLSACSFETPDATLDAVADYALLQTLPEPGPRPASFECELLDVTASGDDPHITTFEHEGFEPVTVYSEDAITDVHMSGVRVVVVGDVFAVDEHWVRLGECE